MYQLYVYKLLILCCINNNKGDCYKSKSRITELFPFLLSPGHDMFVLREYAHLLDRLVAKNYGKAVYRGASHPRCQSLSKHTPPLRPPQMADCVRNTPSVDLKSILN